MAQDQAPEDTITALATPAGNGAIAVIRISGENAFQIIDSCFEAKSGQRMSNASSHTLHLGDLRDGENLIDEVLVSVFRNPKSYTGEDCIEVSCHGSTYIQQQILEVLNKQGCRLANPGEFTLRAYLNRKLDLSQAEAVADLIASSTEASHKVALGQMRGGFSADLKQLREKLIDFASLIELELDFAEEDVEFADRTELEKLISLIMDRIDELIGSFKLGNAIKEGVQVAIVGEPNAGKSTLLNALLNEERAIVSDIAGTTRDTIEDEMVIEGIRYRFIDTAGLRDSDDTIEVLGIERALEKASSADIVIYLYDASIVTHDTSLAQIEKLKTQISKTDTELVIVANKIDKVKSEAGDQTICISAKHQQNISAVKDALTQIVNSNSVNKEQTVVTNQRHVAALSETRQSLNDALSGLKSSTPSDLISIDIKKALFHLGQITGEVSTDDLLGNIFGKFCIGK